VSDQANALEKKEAFFTLNARVSYEYKSVRAFLGIENITGEEYSEYVVANAGGLTFYPAPETRWTAGIEYRF
jgi:iron complex outermembrane receptor protein